MSGTDDAVEIGSGLSPEGAAVTYWEIDRPGTIGAKGAAGFIIEVRDADGKRITHSDTLDGLKKAGYKEVVETPIPTVVSPQPVRSIEDELS